MANLPRPKLGGIGITNMDQLDEYFEAGNTGTSFQGGHTLLMRWFRDGPWGEAAQHIIWQFVVFYAVLLVGFGCLYFMIRSTATVRARLKEIRKELAETLKAQQDKRFDLENYSGLAYGGIA